MIRSFRPFGRLVSVFALLVLIATGTADEPDRPESNGAFKSLFDGKSLSGWQGNTDLWKAENGRIVGNSPGIKHNDFLATSRKFRDFELRLEFKLHGGVGNSGVQFRSKRDSKSTAMIGFQADIGQRYWGCLYDEHRRNRILAQAPEALAEHLVKDGWNKYVIRAKGRHIEQFINGFQTVDYTEADDSIDHSGVIALQIHSGPAMRVEFRRIMIREFKPL